MNFNRFFKHRARNVFHTVLLIGSMSVLLSVCSELLFGDGVGLWVLLSVVVAMLIIPDVSSNWVLQLYQAVPLQPQNAPQLHRLVEELSYRAGLKSYPRLYWIPSPMVNAFATGHSSHASLAITDGILNALTRRELAGVLAHEISHIANHDLRLMALADLMSRMTHVMSLLGMLLMMLSLPMILLGQASVSIAALLLLMSAPSISALLQLGLSRIREFDADLEAVRLTHDPEGLASALHKIEHQQASLWQRIFLPGYKNPEPSLLRTHPDTTDRIEKLLALKNRPDEIPYSHDWQISPVFPRSKAIRQKPRHRIIHGLWH